MYGVAWDQIRSAATRTVQSIATMLSSNGTSTFLSRSICLILIAILPTGSGLAAEPRQGSINNARNSRRAFLSSSAATLLATTCTIPVAANARYVLNEGTGEYDEVEDDDWQTAWGKRLDKAKKMGADEVFLAAQGAGNLDLKDGEESDASKKRRALAGCRNEGTRQKAGMKDTKECTARVLGGDFQFMIDAI